MGATDLRASGLKSLDCGISFEAYPLEHNHRLHNALHPPPPWETAIKNTMSKDPQAHVFKANTLEMCIYFLFLFCFLFSS